MNFESLISDLKSRVDQEADNHDVIYITVLNIDYVIIDCEEYSDIDPNGDPLLLCKLFLAFSGEKRSTECEILITQEDLEKVLEEHKKREQEHKEILNRSLRNNDIQAALRVLDAIINQEIDLAEDELYDSYDENDEYPYIGDEEYESDEW